MIQFSVVFFSRHHAKNLDSGRDLHKILPSANYFLFIAAKQAQWTTMKISVCDRKTYVANAISLDTGNLQEEMFLDVHVHPSYTISFSNLINWYDKTLQLNIYRLLVLANFHSKYDFQLLTKS